MPRNNGIYTAPPSNWNPATDGLPADPESWNDLLADIAAALSQSVSKDGQTQITGDMNWGGNRITNLGQPAAAGDALRNSMITKGADIASAATINIPVDGILFDVTGDATISTITGGFSGKFAFLRFSDALVIEHSSNLILPGASDYRTTAGELVLVVRNGTTWQMFASGSAYQIGDFLDTLRTMDDKWLRRNGALYEVSNYPVLASLLPPLPDGVVWSREDLGAPVIAKKFTQAGNRTIAISVESSDTIVLESDDGQAWAPVATIENFSANDICFDLEIFIMCGLISDTGDSVVSISPDGETWSSPSVISSSLVSANSVASDGSIIVVVGNQGKIFTSPDGTNWTERTSGISGNLLFVDFINGVFIATGNQGTILTSSDGLSWIKRREVPAEGALLGAAYFGGVYVAVGVSGVITTSSNLSSWSLRSSGASVNINSVAGNERGFIAVGANGTVRISDTSAVSWAASAVGSTEALRDVVIDLSNPSKYYVAGLSGEALVGLRTLPTQFRVPDDNPEYGWIKAL